MELRKADGAVIGVVVASYFVHHLWMALKVVGARKTLKVPYPHLYASKEATPDLDATSINTFNCTQRGHQNSLEMLPSFLALLTASGMRYPYTSSGLGVLYLLGRISYVNGYSSGVPEKRVKGAAPLMYIGVLGLAITATKAAVELLAGRE